MTAKPLDLLQKYFGYEQFRPGQLAIINTILSFQDSLAILPTGGGKSVCFQIPALTLDGTSLIISPLISLMQDQVQALEEKQISATFLNSSLSQKELAARLARIKQGCYRLIYIAPERLQNRDFFQACQTIRIPLLAIDEAHCVSMWGHDFRPSYQYISTFCQRIKPRPVVAAFTATATPEVREDIVQLLSLDQPQIFLNSFLRTNLAINLINCQSAVYKQVMLLKILKLHAGQAGIIYCATRKKCQQLSKWLNLLNFRKQLCATNIAYYHGRLDTKQRAQVQERFIDNQIQLICATNAFGMGVDKPDIRFVIHYQQPGTLENFYQEIGRGGRDRQPAKAYLLAYQPDINIQLGFIHQLQDQKRQQINLHKLGQMAALSNTNQCLQRQIGAYFGEENLPLCKKCSFCQPLELKFNQTETKYYQQLEQIKTDFPLSLQTKHYLALLQPQTPHEWLSIPGIGPPAYEQIRRQLKDKFVAK